MRSYANPPQYDLRFVIWSDSFEKHCSSTSTIFFETRAKYFTTVEYNYKSMLYDMTFPLLIANIHCDVTDDTNDDRSSKYRLQYILARMK